MTFEELRQANVTRCRESWHHETDWSPMDWLACVMGELGELAHELKEVRRVTWDTGGYLQSVRGRPEHERLANEIADTLIYLDLLAARCGIDLAACVAQKFNATSRKVGSSIFLPEQEAAS